MDKKRREYIYTGVVMAVTIPLMVIMTKLSYEICVQGKSADIVEQYEPVCYCLMVLLVVIGIAIYFMLGEEEGNKNET